MANPFGYAGGYRDSESGLYDLQARYDDPSTQQFLTVDPLVAATGQAYNYVGGSPLNGRDPAGLAWASPQQGRSPVLGPAVPGAIPLPEPVYPPPPYRISFENDGPWAAYWAFRDFHDWLLSQGPYANGANGGGFSGGFCSANSVQPNLFYIKVKNLGARIPKHDTYPDQAASQAGRTTEDLLRFDPDDPISGQPYQVGNEDGGPWQGLVVQGGNHRLNELYQRFLRGEISGELDVPVLYEPVW